MYSCRYQRPSNGLSSTDEHDLPDHSVPNSVNPLASPRISIERPVSSVNGRPSVPTSPFDGSCYALPLTYSPNIKQSAERLGGISGLPAVLDATELSLLSHYLSHTSRSIPFDSVDLYALSVGIPNLAFKSTPVMSSLIALAAACKSHDIVMQTNTPLDSQTMVEVLDLLRLAERHHRASLHHIQAAMSHSGWFDSVLINAALMVLYASANHSIRVRLAGAAKRAGQHLPIEILPQHSQWISFTRAAHTASSAVLKVIVDSRNEIQSPIISSAASSPVLPMEMLRDNYILTPQDGPSESTHRLFFPVVESTYARALEHLRRRTISITAHYDGHGYTACTHPEVNACLESLSILETCFSAALYKSRGGYVPKSPGNKPEPVRFDIPSRVSPWVAKI